LPLQRLVRIRLTAAAGVLLACGTDDVYASMWPRESTHREMELLVMAGIPELEQNQTIPIHIRRR
jgi:hypothetical protein